MRHTRAHTANRRSHHALKGPEIAVCKNCGQNHRPHHMCLACGFYNGRQVIDLVAQKDARNERLKAKAERIRLQGEQVDDSEAKTAAEALPVESAEETKK